MSFTLKVSHTEVTTEYAVDGDLRFMSWSGWEAVADHVKVQTMDGVVKSVNVFGFKVTKGGQRSKQTSQRSFWPMRGRWPDAPEWVKELPELAARTEVAA